jgi:hypothetical protein
LDIRRDWLIKEKIFFPSFVFKLIKRKRTDNGRRIKVSVVPTILHATRFTTLFSRNVSQLRVAESTARRQQFTRSSDRSTARATTGTTFTASTDRTAITLRAAV